MNLQSLLAITTGMILLAWSADGQIIAFQDSVSIGETPYEYTFTVKNNSGSQKPLIIEYSFPAKYEKMSQPAFIDAGAQEQVKIKIYPQKSLEGATYVGTIKTQIGQDFSEKNLIMEFLKEDKCTVSPSAEIDMEGNAALKLSNSSYNSKTVELKSINGPAGWEITGEKKFEIAPNETKTVKTKINMKGAYNGEAELAFSCMGDQITAKTRVTRDEKGILQQITGMFTAAQFGRNIAGLAVNLFLGIVAAVLLVAFIARLVKASGR